MKTEQEEMKEEIKEKIKKLRKQHIIRNGYPVSYCSQSNCYYRKKIKELKQKLKKK
jgi:hypothetical protein